MFASSRVLVSATFAAAALAASNVLGPVTDLIISDGLASPDGFQREAILVNGVVPGPLIAANKTDHFKINVHNQLSNHSMNATTTVHWHGIFQSHTNWADGTAFVTQCPITGNHSFLYQFDANGQAGTFWYHSHLTMQYCDGLRGPLVIYDPDDPQKDLYDVDDETTVITLADWYHQAMNLGPIPQNNSATLINGKGRYSGGPEVDLAVISVEQNKRYRFRLVSTSCEPNYVWSIDEHTMVVIEADGNAHQPVEVDSIQIFAGQRYSFVLNANQSVDNYWIRSQPNLGANTTFLGGLNSAILRYVGANETDPTTQQTPSVKPLQETDLVPLTDPAAPANSMGDADVKINLQMGFNTTIESYTINGVPYRSPPVPVLLQILSGAQSAQSLMPSGSVYTLPRNSTVELSIPVGTAVAGPHPMHLHGHAFSVVRAANQSSYNYANPPRRDVVSTGGASDNVTIRFDTNNPGPWILHCHIDSHLFLGLAVVFAEDPADVGLEDPVPAEWDQLCKTYDALPSDQD